MELRAAERSCCVVSVSAPSVSAGRAVSCSGVLLDPGAGTVLCAGLPFSRYLSDRALLCRPLGSLPPPSFHPGLRIRVFSPSESPDAAPPLREAPAELLLLVRCPEFQRALRAVFSPGQWRFHGGEEEQEEEELVRDAQALGWFAVLRVGSGSPGRCPGLLPWQSGSSLRKGRPVVACGSPFGSLCTDLFIGTLSRGVISNLAGEDNAVILTDARCLPGTEGGGLFAMGAEQQVSLAGLIVSPFGWKDTEWIGLTLVCSVHAVLRSLVRCVDTLDPLGDLRLQGAETSHQLCLGPGDSEDVELPTVCLVDSGQFWGSGVMVAPHLAVTCRHVVNGKPAVKLRFHQGDRFEDVVGDVLFSTRPLSPYDLALVQLRDSSPKVQVPMLAQSFNPGEDVVVVGYGGLGRSCGPSLTGGVLSKTISCRSNPVMLQTTCAVQAGTSGGAVVRRQTGELLGVVSSNTRDVASKVTYPHLNFCVPTTAFLGPLRLFEQTRDVEALKTLDTEDEDVRRVWRLQGTQSKL